MSTMIPSSASLALASAASSQDLSGYGLGPQIAFFALALLTLGGAIVTITRRNMISAVMAMVATFFGIAGLYALLSAHFLAVLQILVYAGGIMVLFVFVVMVLNREDADPWALRSPVTKALGVGALVYLVVRMGQLIITSNLRVNGAAPPPSFGTAADVGERFFTDFLFPFEAVSVLLIIAVIGAVVLARTTVAKATSLYELPEGETDQRQPQHAAEDEVVGVFVPSHGGPPASGGSHH